MEEQVTGQSTTQDAVSEVISKAGELAVLPQVVYKIMEMTGTDDSSAVHLEREIVIDPAFSARILSQANSAYYALPRKVTSIREAVMFLGFKSVRQLAMTVGVFDLFLGKTDKESLRRRSWWRHSLDTAVCARVIAERLRTLSPDEGFTCGLLHLIGKTVLDRFNPEKYEKVQGVVDQGAPDMLAERAMFGCDHVAVAIACGEKWGFPEPILAGIDYFSTGKGGGPHERLRALTAVASRLATLAISGRGADELTVDIFPGWALDSLNISEDQGMALIEAGIQSIAESAKMNL